MKPLMAYLFILSSVCCSKEPDLEKERASIIALLDMERKAHFEKNVSLFMSEFSDSMVSVNKGAVVLMEKEKMRKRIQEYFDGVEFLKWDDMVAPKISFSEDARLAYAVVEKQVILSIRDRSSALQDTTDFAWVAIYRKIGCEWKLECNVSTNK
ncbi:MAG: hypothetical protein H7122_10040 [Chitinophagaceae bacterium]|nr:hypothetical protein [Chitinophagaceae bacterium]